MRFPIRLPPMKPCDTFRFDCRPPHRPRPGAELCGYCWLHKPTPSRPSGSAHVQPSLSRCAHTHLREFTLSESMLNKVGILASDVAFWILIDCRAFGRGRD